jgi:serine/threonine-protein kinase
VPSEHWFLTYRRWAAYAAAMAVDDLSGRRLGGFELIEPLGEGSFGSVWRARQVRLDRDVAVKVLDPLVARDPNAASRFEREGRSAASLDHPSIVPVYEAGDDDGLYYLAMRLVDGETLADVIEREAPLSEQRVAELLGPIADALDAAHATGLIHRDVKPANILIEDGRPYLSDFGIAASARELGRYTTGSIGTAEYMSPEQARGDTVDHRSDLYALGCVAYHAVTGRSPFARDDIVATLLAHSTDEVPETGDDGLDAFFAKALAKSPDDRFSSGAEFMDAFDGGDVVPLGGHGVSTRRSSSRRRAAALMAVVGAVSFGIAGVVVSDRNGSQPVGDPAPSPTAAPTRPPVVSDPPRSTAAAAPDPGNDAVATTVAVAIDTTAAATVRDGGSVRLGTTLTLDDPNPHSSLDTSKVLSEWVLPVMYRIDERLEPVPSLAAGPPVAVDGDPLTLRWEIRADRSWDDGSPVTAADIVATHQYLVDPATNASSTLLYASIETIDARSATEVEIGLAEPNGAAHLLFSTIHPIIQAAAWEAHRDAGGTAADFLDDGVTFSAGPYRVATGRTNPGEIELVPNTAWAGEPDPALESIEVANYADSIALVEAKARGEVDMIWVDDVTRDELLDATAIDGTVTQVGTANAATQLTMNLTTPALEDPLVRQAIFHALDRDAIVDTAVGRKTGGIVDPWNSLVFAAGQRDDSVPFADGYDPDLSEELLDRAGWTRPPGRNAVRQNAAGELLELQGVLLADADSNNAALAIADNLGDVGIQFRAAAGNSESTNERINSGDFDLLLQFRVFSNDPIATEFSFASDRCPATIDGCSGDGVNVGSFSDPRVDEALARAALTSDPDDRLDVFAEVDRLLFDALPAIPLFVEPAFVTYDDDIVGVVMAPNVGPLVSLAGWALVDA